MANPLLLSYNLNAAAAAGLDALCESQGIRHRPVAPAEYALPIGALAGLPAARAGFAPAEPFSEPMLVMCHMLGDQLDAFLRGMRAGGVGPIPLKAVLTPTNVAWSSRRLRDELAQEHAAMKGRR